MDDDFDRDESCCQTNRRVTGAQDTPEWVGDGRDGPEKPSGEQ
jgi:hypothetical protein